MSAKDVMSDAAHALAPDPEEVHASNAQKLEKGGPNERDNEPFNCQLLILQMYLF